ncbi:MAG: Fic family protein [Polyangiales bacterium]
MWNWQQSDWPNFRFDKDRLEALEAQFHHRAGRVVGAFTHLDENEQTELTVGLLSEEALSTSAIEGEVLERASVQSSLRKQFGLVSGGPTNAASEQGIAELAMDLYRSYRVPLAHSTLYRWQAMLMRGRAGVGEVGAYRCGEEPMQVVSGPTYRRVVHFEAPPSARVPGEMDGLVRWFNATRDDGLGPLARAGLVHLYFVSVHPFEDGNGRIARALSEKSLAQSYDAPTLTALSMTIEARRREYYGALAAANGRNEVSAWLVWFAETVLAAQELSLRWVGFFVEKAKYLRRLASEFNPRQKKVILRMLREGPLGFKGGLSAGNYSRIAGAPPATARRDLVRLVGLGALLRTGERKGTRYWLPFVPPEPSRES